MKHNIEADQTDDAVLPAVRDERGEESERSFGPADTTAYLLQSEANRKRLLATIENINAGRNLVEIS